MSHVKHFPGAVKWDMKKIWLDKLHLVMKERGLKNKPLSLAAGFNETFIRDLDNGSDTTISKLVTLADHLSLPISYFFNNESPAPRQVPVVGYASGGEEWTPFDDSMGGEDGLDSLALDFTDSDPIAIRVRGHSMIPVFRDGDDLICSRQRGIDLASVVGKDCVVRTMDQRCYIKHILKGAIRNTYRLRSYNPAFPDIDDVALDWAAPVVWIKRKDKK